MKNFILILFVCFSLVSAEEISISYILDAGAINGTDVTGQQATITLNLLDGTTFNNETMDLNGRVQSIQINVGAFTLVDNAFDFAQPDAFISTNGGSFFANFLDQDDFEPHYSGFFGAHSDEFIAAQNGETLTDYFNRAGSTFTTDFGQLVVFTSTVFEQGGAITTNFLVNAGRLVTVNANQAVPEPSTYFLLLVLGLFGFSRYRKNIKQK